MKIHVLVALAVFVATAAAVPAGAQDAAPPAGRYQLTSGADSGFVRLDTRTGSVSHCSQNDSGVWQCDPIMDSGLADRLTTLSDKVDRLSADLGRLSLRVDALTADAGVPPPVAGAGDAATAKPVGFARATVHRLLEMIRTLKHGRTDQT